MAIVKEPLNVDFFVDPKPLGDKEQEMISEYIRASKAKSVKKKSQRKPTQNKKKNISAK
jgi:hypothetical protein